MTGFGLGKAGRGEDEVTITVRAVNSRYLDLKIRGIEQNPVLEAKIRDRVGEVLQRGSIQINIALPNGSSGTLVFNRKRFEAIENILLMIQREYGRHLEMGDVFSANDLFIAKQVETVNTQYVMKALNKALSQTEEMRVAEGAKIQKDLEDRVRNLQNLLDRLKELAKTIAVEKREQYQVRIQQLLGKAPVDENRLAVEIAILAEKADITEEIVRCESHFHQFLNFLEPEKPVGKRMNFLLQEIGREINTIGAKSTNVEITKLVIDLKDEVEKIREQVQNVL
ncbi:MAG: YicC family protein [FCB group bacterium]|nr:YicC family protein [FCB group bacterium]